MHYTIFYIRRDNTLKKLKKDANMEKSFGSDSKYTTEPNGIYNEPVVSPSHIKSMVDYRVEEVRRRITRELDQDYNKAAKHSGSYFCMYSNFFTSYPFRVTLCIKIENTIIIHFFFRRWEERI